MEQTCAFKKPDSLRSDLFETKNEKSKITLGICLGIIATMLGSSLPAGHNLGVINAPQQQIRDWITMSLVQEYNLIMTESQEYIILGCVVSIFLVGALIGSTIGPGIADKLGRRNGFLLVHSVCFASGLIIVSCQHSYIIELLFIGRLAAGLATGAATSMVPLYLSEIAPPSWRGVMGTLFPFGLCLGILISQILGVPSLFGKASTWAYLVGGHFLYVLPSLLLHPFLPLSPTHLFLNKGDASGAHKVLWKLRDGNIQMITLEEVALIAASIDKEMKNVRGGAWQFITDRKYSAGFVSVFILNACQQLVGINAVFFYSTLVFTNSGFETGLSQAASLCGGIPNLLMSALAVPLIRYVHRRLLLLTSILLYGTCQILLVFSLYYASRYTWASWAAFISIFASVLTYGIGLGPVPYMIGTEIFPSDVRGVGLALGALSNWGANLLVGLMFPLVQSKLGIFSFCIFICFCVILFIFVYFFLPETLPSPPNNETSSDLKNSHVSSQRSPLLLLSTNSRTSV